MDLTGVAAARLPNGARRLRWMPNSNGSLLLSWLPGREESMIEEEFAIAEVGLTEVLEVRFDK